MEGKDIKNRTNLPAFWVELLKKRHIVILITLNRKLTVH
jgi:hypothetical protein